jgi:hypothetical protein
MTELDGVEGVTSPGSGGDSERAWRPRSPCCWRPAPASRSRRRRLQARGGYLDDDGDQVRSLAHQRLVRELLEAQRRVIVRLRNQGEISNEVMHCIEGDLDLEDARLEI